MHSSAQTRILIAGGGTGGHVFPAYAIKEAIARKKPEAQIVFVGTGRGLEARYLPQKGERLYRLWISGISRTRRSANILLPFRLIISFLQGLWLIITFRPQLMIGTGGYVMGPILFLGQRLGIPTVLQEQNSLPGLTTRKLARRAAHVCIGIEDAADKLKTSRITFTGNPVRSSFFSAPQVETGDEWRLAGDRKTILVFGGSQGAVNINEAVADALPQILDSYNLIWQTGRRGLPERTDRTLVKTETGLRHLIISEFIDNMHYAYTAADAAVCRAGAITLAELAISRLPAILIPYPAAADDHQTANAEAYVKAGAAVVIRDRELTGDVLLKTLSDIMNADKLRNMSEGMGRLARPDAAERIAELALAAVRNS